MGQSEQERPVAVFDIDGVLADVAHRLHHLRGSKKNWKEFFAAARYDTRHSEGFELLKELSIDHDIVFLTGRPEYQRSSTTGWLTDGLQELGLGVEELLMRPAGNFAKSAQTKSQMLLDLAQRRQVAVVVDDDLSVVLANRANGFKVIHATWGLEDEDLKRAQAEDGKF